MRHPLPGELYYYPQTKTPEQLLEIGASLADRDGLKVSHSSSGYENFGHGMNDFEILNRHREVIDSIFSTPEPTTSPEARAWPAAQMTHILDGLLTQSLKIAARQGNKEVTGAYHLQYRIGQMVSHNVHELTALGQHDDPSLAKAARRLTVHKHFSLPGLDEESAPPPFAHIKEVITDELPTLSLDMIRERYALHAKYLINEGTNKDIDAFIDIFEEADTSRAVRLELYKLFSPIDHSYLPHSPQDTKVMARFLKFQRLDPSADDWQDSLTNFEQDIQGASPEIVSTIRAQLLLTMRKRPPLLKDRLAEWYGLNLAELTHGWTDALGNEHDTHMPQYTRSNLQMINNLEVRHPGSTKFLKDNFNIRNFARYPYRLLAQQYLDAKQQQATPQDPTASGVQPLTNKHLVADYDHSRAFQDMRKYDQIAHIAHQAGQRYEIHEIGDTDQINDILFAAQARSIGMIILTAHGSGTSATLGRSNWLFQNELYWWRTKPCRNTVAGKFALGAVGIFDSCHAGMPYGIGEVISDFLDISVVGPTTATSLSSITNTGELSSTTPLSVSVRYHDNVARSISPSNQPFHQTSGHMPFQPSSY